MISQPGLSNSVVAPWNNVKASGPNRLKRFIGRSLFKKVCDFSKPPFAKWFVGGETNLCYNAVDRHLPLRANQPALHYISTEIDAAAVFHLPGALRRGLPVFSSSSIPGTETRRSGNHLSSDDPGGRVCHAGMRSAWAGAFGGLRRFRPGQPRDTDRGRRGQSS